MKDHFESTAPCRHRTGQADPRRRTGITAIPTTKAGQAQEAALPIWTLKVDGRVERFGCRATESFESLNDPNSLKNLSEFRKKIEFIKIQFEFFRNSENLRNPMEFLLIF